LILRFLRLGHIRLRNEGYIPKEDEGILSHTIGFFHKSLLNLCKGNSYSQKEKELSISI